MQAALDDGARINARHAHTMQTPLMTATLQGQADAVEFLLQAGADASLPEKDGYTPMHGAAFQGRLDVMRVLVAAAGSLDVHQAHDGDGFVPFFRACWGRHARHADVVRYMIADLGVDAQMAAPNGATCWDMTSNPKTRDVLRELGGAPKHDKDNEDPTKEEL